MPQEAALRRLNVPPGWPVPPEGWVPPPDWKPDPAWPPPPAGWPLWVDDEAPAPAAAVVATSTRLNWAIGGAALVPVGSFMPFISAPLVMGSGITDDAQGVSALFGLVLVGLAAGLRPPATRSRCAVALLVAGGLGALGYAAFIVLGQVGFESEGDSFMGPTEQTFDPDVGVVLCLAGCVIAAVAALSVLRHRDPGYARPF